MNNKSMGEITTFYSYKGGTGRSMALANVACLLSKTENVNENVLMIDWDLEAPGLHQFFRGKFTGIDDKTGDLPNNQLGLIDLFYEIKNHLIKHEVGNEIPDGIFTQIDIRKYIIKINDLPLSLMPAGRFDDDLYSVRVNEFDWSDFFDKFPLFIAQFAQYLKENYKYTLIDSRTGYTDISGICTSIMPEKLVTVFTPNRQSVLGVAEMIRRAIDYRKRSDDLRPLMIFPLPSRIENSEIELQKKWRFGNSEQGVLGYQAQLESTFIDVYDLPECDLTKYFDEYQLQYVSKYSYGEEISVLSERPEDRLSLARSFESFAERIISSKNPWEDIPESWLTSVQLRENPFLHQHAEYDESLPAYFTRFPNLYAVTTSDLTFERKPWFFFGNDGSGKTALRKFIAARGRPQRPDSDMVCIEYDQVEFEHLLNTTEDINEFQVSFVQSIFDAVSPYTGNAIQTSQPPGNLRGNLAALSGALHDVGINWALCLIDPGRATFEWKGSQASTTSLITSLFLAFSEVGGYGFRYFLPASMKEELKPTFSRLPFNYIRAMDIKWDERTLRDMLGKRMTQLSVDQTAPYRSVGELCGDEHGLSTLIDSEIASLAQGNPRAAIWLANSLIEQHCDNYPPVPRITLETWDNVKRAWREQGESRILGTSGSSGFWVLSDRIYYQNKEIILPERSDRLLKALIQMGSGFCSKQELIKAGWTDEKNLEGISEKALSEAMRRMKEELKKELRDKGFEPFDRIKSVRGRGYRLVQPSIESNA